MIAARAQNLGSGRRRQPVRIGVLDSHGEDRPRYRSSIGGARPVAKSGLSDLAPRPRGLDLQLDDFRRKRDRVPVEPVDWAAVEGVATQED